MAGAAKSINIQNWKYILAPYVSLNAIALLVVVVGSENASAVSWITFDSAALSVGCGVLTLGLNGLISDNHKSMLVFWRLRSPLPGCRAFSHFMHEDPRVDPRALRTRFGPLPSAPEDQNRLWYRIYRMHADETSIADAHRGFLATRDLSGITLVFLAMSLHGHLLSHSHKDHVLLYNLALVVVFMLMALAAKNYGERMVTDVLASAGARQGRQLGRKGRGSDETTDHDDGELILA